MESSGSSYSATYPDQESSSPQTRTSVLTIAAVTAANGADNVAVYTAVFAIEHRLQIIMTLAVFAAMLGLWCWLAHCIVNHAGFRAPLQRWGAIVLPFVLLGLGIMTLLAPLLGRSCRSDELTAPVPLTIVWFMSTGNL